MKPAVYIMALLVGLLPVVTAVSSPLVPAHTQESSCCCAPAQAVPGAGPCCCCASPESEAAMPEACGCSFVPLDVPDTVAVPAATDVLPQKKLTIAPVPALQPCASDLHVSPGRDGMSHPADFATGPPVPVLHCAFLC
jgi:hypothetical protein